MTFFKVVPARIVVVHDDLDLPLGTLRIKAGGGHGGHNGIRDITEKIGPDFVRVRCGIGRPDMKSKVHGHVLQAFGDDEREAAKLLVQNGADCVGVVVTTGIQAAQAKYHADGKTPRNKPRPVDGGA
jgi:PTH1 family peptidyl-tRNA hydrolase